MNKFEEALSRGIYRSRDGAILGVCKGIAGHFDFSVFKMRLLTLIIMVFSGFWPVTILYCIAALVMKPEPVLAIHTEEEQAFYDNYLSSKKDAVFRLKRKFENLEHRIQRMEHIVTEREFDWENRI